MLWMRIRYRHKKNPQKSGFIEFESRNREIIINLPVLMLFDYLLKYLPNHKAVMYFGKIKDKKFLKYRL